VPALLPAEPSPLIALRAATRDDHHRVDCLMDLGRLSQRAHYGRVLQVFDAFLPAWERAVLAGLPPARHAWLARRSRRPFLARDLQALGLPARQDRFTFPPFADAAPAWGSLYVIEGSALGAQVITRTLAASGLDARSGAAYFHGWGADTAAMWREFRQLLEQELRAPAAVAQACDAARLTFQTLSGLLERALHERTAAA